MSVPKIEGILGRSIDVLKFDPAKILVHKGFNPRGDYDVEPDEFDVASLKDFIKNNGIIRLSPIRVQKKEDGTLVLIDGERRLRAVLELLHEGEPIAYVPGVLEPQATKEADLLAIALSSNQGKPLTPQHQAQAFQRLVNYGWAYEEIASKSGCSTSHVYNRMALLEASPEVQEAAESGAITTSEQVAIVRKARKQGTSQAEILADTTEKKSQRKIINLAPRRDRQNLKLQTTMKELLDEHGVSAILNCLIESATAVGIYEALCELDDSFLEPIENEV
jgi:ParB/RepB/Spo0J family partition protein